MSSSFILTSESVSEGHPDKVADRISDAVLDAYLREDANARVACETLVTTNYVCIAGEVGSVAEIPPNRIEELVRATIADLGFTGEDDRFGPETVDVDVRLHAQSREIANAVVRATHEAQGAGDQGMMFGYATDETDALMPAPITWAHAITRRLATLRRSGEVAWLRPDSKSQVSVRYRDGQPVEVTQLVVSTQHRQDTDPATIREAILEDVVPAVIDAAYLPPGWQDQALVNPSGSFVSGGPAVDTGLTGRKIIVDTYGGAARHGGGAFSGKDPSKVDRSGAYAARWVAKNVVASGLASRCEIELAYAIGVAEPVAILVETCGTGAPGEELEEWIRAHFDLTPHGIIAELDLLRPIYEATAAYGHFGREPGEDGAFPWERVRQAAGVG
ncbi:MAG TPA: methionine adenosyltransferase [Longimicrobiales bacterium]|nr:methionine adenosyltransferase [Longimicrobiales bacterium]